VSPAERSWLPHTRAFAWRAAVVCVPWDSAVGMAENPGPLRTLDEAALLVRRYGKADAAGGGRRHGGSHPADNGGRRGGACTAAPRKIDVAHVEPSEVGHGVGVRSGGRGRHHEQLSDALGQCEPGELLRRSRRGRHGHRRHGGSMAYSGMLDCTGDSSSLAFCRRVCCGRVCCGQAGRGQEPGRCRRQGFACCGLGRAARGRQGEQKRCYQDCQSTQMTHVHRALLGHTYINESTPFPPRRRHQGAHRFAESGRCEVPSSGPFWQKRRNGEAAPHAGDEPGSRLAYPAVLALSLAYTT
jgi:hypothetical protein